MSLESNGVDRLCSLRKIPTQLRGTNFFIRLARFCTEFCNATERCQLHKNSIEHYETWVLGSMGWMSMFVAKNSDKTSWHELLHHFGPFCTEFCKATKRFQMYSNSMKHTKIWVWDPTRIIGCVWCENLRRDSVARILHQFGPFCIEFCKATKRSKCIQIVQNKQKHEFRVQWGGSGAFATKNSDATSWH